MSLLKLLSAVMFALLIISAGCSSASPPLATTSVIKPITRQYEAKLLMPPNHPDLTINTEIESYINKLGDRGTKLNQGVWIQSEQALLANYQGTVPLKAASITKVATTLVALKTWGPKHQFVTLIGRTGELISGVVEGDLVIQGGSDPFFKWEEAVALGNTLNQMGIKRIKGNLAIAGKFYMNYNSDSLVAGNLFKLGLNAQTWPPEAKIQSLLTPGTPQPQVVIEGSVLVSSPDKVVQLVRHLSLPLAQILKQMNLYSNNQMAIMLADSVGGAKLVAQKAALFATVPTEEIRLKNGAGAADNRLSPRAACGMFLAIENYLQSYNMTIADVFAVIGKDLGILKNRPLPLLAVVKTGTLEDVSAVAGAMPTEAQGVVWFAIMNVGENAAKFSQEQDILLQSLLNHWGQVESSPAELKLSPSQ